MGTRLFVSNIPFDIDSDSDLQAALDSFGVSSCKLIKDRETGRSRGFGFLEFPTQEAAEKTLTALNGYLLGNRPLHADWAQDQKRREGGPGGRSQKPATRENEDDAWRSERRDRREKRR
jgi:RNA recognition motif-containing protein